MPAIKSILFSFLPFAVFGFFHGFAKPFYASDREMMLIMSVTAVIILCLIVIIQLMLHDGHYFPSTVLLGFLLITGLILFIPENQYAEFISSGGIISAALARPLYILFAALFIMAVIPAIFKKPFTFYFAKKGVPEAFWGTEQFLKINLIINYIWAALFAGCFAAQFSAEASLQFGVPAFLKLGIGLPATKLLPSYLQNRFVPSGNTIIKDYIKSARDAITGMPAVFNKNAAENLSIIYQFRIHGDENFDGFIEINNGSCTYHDGIHNSPDLTFISPADVYIKIARGEIQGDSAYMQGLYRLEGELKYAMLLNKIFSSVPAAQENKTDTLQYKSIHIDLESKKIHKIKPGKIKKIAVIQGSPRKPGESKTGILTDAFIKGCISAGAEVEVINLREKKINHCIGCYSCWTKTPGVCVFNDDAADIMKKEQEADLTVYAWPLYHFGINSIMKKYIERTLPAIQPYLIPNDNGETTHPAREGYKNTKHVVLISVCGFPEVSHFGAASMNFHYIANAGGRTGMNIAAELYRPASEILNNPFMKDESDRVLNLAEKAGVNIVKNGCIDNEIIEGIAKVTIEKDDFRKMSNMSWDMCIKESKTLAEMQAEWIRRGSLVDI
jgi:multimeric flavodoxin WrbA/putative sterol carrier protein